ncbi:hypothetical protein J3R83DRAFT_9186 [Lanmaoa asiatica]|nr:hypothetical protein J3R83DRAFT_9186 [Lanmaoa asiatica]
MEQHEEQEESEYMQAEAGIESSYEHSVTTLDRQVEAMGNFDVASPHRGNSLILLTGSPAGTTSEKVFIQHVDSAVSSVTVEPRAQTEERLGARRNTTGSLVAASPKAAKYIQTPMDIEEPCISLTQTAGKMVNSSYKSDIESHHGQLDESIDSERTANTNPSQSRMESFINQQASNLSDLAAVKEVKEDQHASRSQVPTPSAPELVFAIVEQNTASAKHVEENVAQLATSSGVSTTTSGTSLTTVAVAAVGKVDYSSHACRQSQAEESEDGIHTEDVSEVTPAPPNQLSPTSSTCVPASDGQMTLDAAQIAGSRVVSACAVVAIATGAQLSKEFIHGDSTSSTKVMTQSESEELTARKNQKKHGILEQATSSERETVTGVPQRSSIKQQDGQLDESTSQQCKTGRQIDTWIPDEVAPSDSRGPPPSYQEATLDYDVLPCPPTHPDDVPPGDDCQYPKPYGQYRGDEKLSTLNASSSASRQRPEGASVLERRRAFKGTCSGNDKESILLPVHAEDVPGAHQEILIEGIGERVLDLHIGLVSSECGSSAVEPLTTQHQIDTLSPSHSSSSYEVRTTLSTNSFEDASESRRQECQGQTVTKDNIYDTVVDSTKSSTTRGISAVTVQSQMGVSTVDEDTTHRHTPQCSVVSTLPESQATTTRMSTTVAMQADDKEAWKTVSLVSAPENVVAMESRRSSVAGDHKQAGLEDLSCYTKDRRQL